MRWITKKRDFKKCKACGKKSRYVSKNGYCEKCAVLAVTNNLAQMKLHKGENYDKWKMRLKFALEHLR